MTTCVCLGFGSLADFTRRSWPLMPRWTTRVSPLSSVSSRYLPRRPTDLMVRPSSSARKCLAEGCRRTERPLATETALILRPTTSRARSWRSVSTSGSSGTGQLLPRGAGRLLLGVLLRTSFAGAPTGPAEVDLSDVGPIVVGSGPDDDVTRRALPVAHCLLLQPALVVEVVGFLARPGDVLAELAQDERLGGIPARIEVDRAEDGLEGVGQDGRLGAPARTLFAAAEQEDLAHAQAARHLGQHPGVDHRRAHLRQLP